MVYSLNIIVPVYNSAQYIGRTVKSILTQELSDYEILLIDDGSTDGSSEICDNLSEQYENVRCIHIKNGGPGRARNIGIAATTSEFIAFCDSDDLPTENMYGRLLSILKSNGVDLVMCDIYSERDGKNLGFPWKENRLLSASEVVTELLSSMLGNLNDDNLTQPIWGSSVRCIYRRSLINQHNIRFPEDIRFAEDLVFNVGYIGNCKSCYVLNEALYHYTLNLNSLMNSHAKYNPTHFEQRLNLVKYITDAISVLSSNTELLKRFVTSQRCYFIESIGNAARAIPTHGYKYAYKEIKQIINHPIVRTAFDNFSTKNPKKWFSYNLVHLKASLILLVYYSLRLTH